MFLKSEACVSQMTNWIPTECPPPDKDVKKLIKESAHRFCEKLAAVVDEWDEQSKIVSKIKTNILNIFQRDLDLFEDQIKRIEGRSMLMCCVCLALRVRAVLSLTHVYLFCFFLFRYFSVLLSPSSSPHRSPHRRICRVCDRLSSPPFLAPIHPIPQQLSVPLIRSSSDTHMLKLQRFNRKTHGFRTFSHTSGTIPPKTAGTLLLSLPSRHFSRFRIFQLSNIVHHPH